MDIIKNFIYAGVGLATTTTEKVKEAINELVEKGKISDTEGKKIMDDFFKSTESTKEEFENKWNKLSETLTSKFDLKKTKKEESEVELLKKRVEELEAELAAKSKNTVAKKETTKKTTTRKAVVKKTKVAPKKDVVSKKK